LLVHVVKGCQSQLKEEVLFARYGGEEFVLALKGYTVSEGEIVGNQLREYTKMQPLVTTDGVISVTLSCGVAEATAEKDETLYQLLNKADKALYSAKREGHNQVHVYEGNKSMR
jgi:diguanylate cyclase (GGDEF)-like protein